MRYYYIIEYVFEDEYEDMELEDLDDDEFEEWGDRMLFSRSIYTTHYSAHSGSSYRPLRIKRSL